MACHSAATSGEARNLQKSSQSLKLAFHTKCHTMRNSNCRGSATEHGGTRWELCTLIFDGMAVVHEFIVHKGHIDKCQGLSAFFIRAINSKPFGYCEAYLLFDDYSTNSLKDHTRQLRTAGISSDPGNKVDDNTPTQI